MTISKLPLLVSSHWLREQISASSQKLKARSLQVLDTSWVPKEDVDGYKEFYLRAHVPSAVHFDLNKINPKRNNSVKYNIPDSNVFRDYVEELGISNSTHVVAYDCLDSKPSFRSWFLFRLFGHDKFSVLDGALQQWLRNGFAVTTDEPDDIERGRFNPKFRPHLLRDYDDMVKNVRSQSDQVLDSRGRKFYCGGEDAPQGGHIPNSVNVPFASLFNEDGTFKSVEDLDKLFKAANVDINKPIIASCQTAMTACSLVAAAHMLGKEDVPVYNGSFTEWSAEADPSDIEHTVTKHEL